MALTPGARIGVYEINALIGAGGMGEVYRAHDTKLNRDVALKILPESFTHDPDRLARFKREAQVLAALNHPHIGAIYGLDEANGYQFLVLELIHGETLADLIAKGPLPLDEALSIATQIAEALEAAHEKGIIHRDLKPANIALTKDGHVKVLDFGLAKATETASGTSVDLANSPTLTSPAMMTGMGAILGTAGYMSPEQARGRAADKRSDLWAFGCVVYELMSGKQVFRGETVTDILAAVVTGEPDWQALPPATPAKIRDLLQRCLQKDSHRRLHDAADARIEIEEALASPRPTEPTTASLPIRTVWRWVAISGLACLIIAAIIGGAVWHLRPPSEPLPVSRSLITLPPHVQLASEPVPIVGLSSSLASSEGRPSRTAMVWSPDGRSIVFSAVQGDRQQLYLRALDQLAAVPIPGTEGASGPFFSPDGRWLGFGSGGVLKKIAVDGSGPATTICETPGNLFGASWGSDDTIIFSLGPEGLWRVSASGGPSQALMSPDAKKGELKYLLPRILPGNRAILFTVTHTPLPTWNDTELVVQSLATGERKVLVTAGADGRYVRSGHLLYLHRGTLMAVPFDLQRLEVTGGAVALIADVMQAANTPNEQLDSGAGQFNVSDTGSLLYVPGGIFPDPERSLVWVDRTGALQPLSLPARAYLSPRLSPDGHRMTVWTQGDRNIWVHDLARGTLTRLTLEARNARAIWTPDGTRITYGSATAGPENLFWKPADGSGSAERLTTSDHQHTAASWSPDGQTLAFVEVRPTTGADIWVLPLAGDRRPRAIIQTRFTEAYPEFSPDGRWLAYSSDESGRPEVYVQPYPGSGPRQQVSTNGGTAPAWSRDGRELFYTTAQSGGGQTEPTKMMVVPLTLRGTFTAGTPRLLFQGRYSASVVIRNYDVTADGRRFLMVQQKERPAATVTDIIFVQGWVEELKRRVPQGR
jgi:serine/threonine protein kinase